MTQHDYEQKKRECLEGFVKTRGWVPQIPKEVFDFIFDRGYALGKKIGNSDFSDAEGEEMLTVPRKKVQEMYADIINDIRDYNGENPEMVGATDPILRERAAGMKAQLRRLFGSKCLPDVKPTEFGRFEEPKPAEPDEEQIAKSAHYSEPKYHKGDKVRYNGYVYEVDGLVGKNRYALKGLNFDLEEDMIDPYEPYTEPEKESRSLSQNIANCDKQFDTILKDSFAKERRLTIAAMAMQGILSNPTAMNGPKLIDGDEEIAAMWSLKFADALIAECEKGGKDESR